MHHPLPGRFRPSAGTALRLSASNCLHRLHQRPDFVPEKERWRLPESMVRHEGDRFVVDTAPAFGKLLVLCDGDGLVLNAVEPVRRSFAHGPGFAPEALHAASGSWWALGVGVVLIWTW